MDIQTSNNPGWGWVLFVGILLLLIGAAAAASPFITTITSVVVFGWLLIFAGIAQLVFSFSYRTTSNFLMHIFTSILTVLIGVLIIANPEVTAITVTLLLAAFFLAAGISRIISALSLRFPQWGWILFGGMLSVVLGALILLHWPSSALWVIGLFIGIELIFTGWTFILAAFVLKK